MKRKIDSFPDGTMEIWSTDINCFVPTEFIGICEVFLEVF